MKRMLIAPTVELSVSGLTGFQVTQGIPATSVPRGHSFENQCSDVMKGINKTNSSKETYRNAEYARGI
ncbi:hypothetical protein ACFL54_05190 [Planctomycetota bacterium]